MDGILAVDRRGRCYLCRRILTAEIQTHVYLETMSVCSDCKYWFLEDSDTQPRTHSTTTTMYSSSLEGSVENMLSQPSPDTISDHRNQTRQQTRVLSDTESDDFDSVFGDSDVFSYAAYESDSDASVVLDTVLDHDDDDSHNDNDDDDEYEEVGNTVGSFVGRIQLQRSLATNGRNLPFDWLSEILSDEGIRNTERRGPTSAAASFAKSLDIVVLDKESVCVICKENAYIGSVMSRLPCGHVYHPSCIMPWLNEKNTCPLCRYELPTDDMVAGVHEYALSQGNNEIGGGRWWFVAAPLVSVVGIGVVLWLGGGVFCGQREDRSGRWWSFL